MYVVAGQAILRLPVEMLSNYGHNVGWWLPDSLIQNKGIFEFGNPIHKLLGGPGDLCARASVHLLHRVTVG
jgi:hypothetical protein